MTCPINDIRNFKAARSESTDNVVSIHREAPIASLHFARADEAEVEVELFTQSNETLTCENETMQNVNANETVEQTATVSVTTAADRYKKIRRTNIIANVCGSVACAAGLVAAAHVNGRDVKRGAIMVGVVSGVTLVNELVGKYRKAEAKQQANHMSEEEYQEVVTNRVTTIAGGTLASFVTGAVIGAFLIKKVAAVATEE